MKYSIRRGCFETNSSSQHSIIVTKNDVHIDKDKIVWDRNKDYNSHDSIYIDAKGRLDLWGIADGYGRSPFQILTTFEEKLKYAMCEFLGYLYIDEPEWDKYYNEFKRIIKSIAPEFKDFYIHKKYEDMYLDGDGNYIPRKNLHYDYWNEKEDRAEYYYFGKDGNKHSAKLDEDNVMEMPNIGRIDHQSVGVLKSFLRKENISLEEFLTNKKYTICIDGDEYNDFEKYLQSGFINKDFIVETYGVSYEDILNRYVEEGGEKT